MIGRYARRSKVMTIANRLVKQGCNRAPPHRHALIMKNWQKRLKHRNNKTARKTPKNGFPMRLLLGANEGIRTPDLLITNQLRYRLRHISKAYSVIIPHFFEECKP